jgi:hypothetical protein
MFSNCSDFVDAYFYLQIGEKFDLYYKQEFEELNSFSEIAEYIRENVTYKYEGIKDEWTSPRETLRRGYGDCDDIALLFANIAHYALDINCSIVAVDSEKREEPKKKDNPEKHKYDTVVNGGTVDHITVYYDGKVYEAYYGYQTNYVINYLYTFEEVFNQ